MTTTIKTWLWIATSVVFEVIGDIACKKASVSSNHVMWIASLAAYNLMLLAWLLAIRETRAITIPGTVWLLSGQVALVIVGLCFGEVITIHQRIGIGLSIIAAWLLSL